MEGCARDEQLRCGLRPQAATLQQLLDAVAERLQVRETPSCL